MSGEMSHSASLKDLYDACPNPCNDFPKEYGFPKECGEISVTGVAMDSREVRPGFLFLACEGAKIPGRLPTHGAQFIDIAVSKGASAIFVEPRNDIDLSVIQQKIHPVPLIEVQELGQKAGYIAAKFYHSPSSSFPVVGVTGTNGKTSISHLIAACVSCLNNQLCGVIGTVGVGVWPQLKDSDRTTPDAIGLQVSFNDFRQAEVDLVVMEVSSHGLDQGRVNGVEFTTAVFTNLTRDHLDYHLSMENYAQAKAKLFEFSTLNHAVVNLDDAYGVKLLDWLAASSKSVVSYGVNHPDAMVKASSLTMTSTGLEFHIHSPWGSAFLQTRLLGRFNVENILAVLSALCCEGYDFKSVISALEVASPVQGRLERVATEDAVLEGTLPVVIVDYAHTPDALEQSLKSLKAHCGDGQLWVVVGCGGDRDQGKRPQMAAIAEQNADRVILSDDNPRTEDPTEIMAHMIAGLEKPNEAIVQHDRQLAIDCAIHDANENDIVLIAGKGHEQYQDIQGVRYPFSDIEQAQRSLAARGGKQ